MVRLISPIVIFVILFLPFGCVKSEKTIGERHNSESNQPEMSFFEALNHVEETQNYEFEFEQYVGYGMDKEEVIALDEFGAGSTWSVITEEFSWYIRSFRVGELGISLLINIDRPDQLGMIFDITTFQKEDKQVHFGTLWEPGPRPNTQSEIPHRLGVYFYEHPDEIRPGLRISPDYLIDMQERQLLVHEPSGEDKQLFLFRDPNPM